MNPGTNLPDIWGEGALLGFSGIDGQTDTYSGFVATLTKECGLLLHTPSRRWLIFSGAEQLVPEFILSDAFSLRCKQGKIILVFADGQHMVGAFPPGVALQINSESQDVTTRGDVTVTHDAGQNDWVVLHVRESRAGTKFCLAYAKTEKQAVDSARKFIRRDVEDIINNRLKIYENMPSLPNKRRQKLLLKCFNVMKVNTLGPEGVFRNHWSTPDRVPHRMMWLWDSVFNALGMKLCYPELAWEFIKSVLERQRKDGMISYMMYPDGQVSEITQPPVLAWGCWELYGALKDKAILQYSLPRLERYLAWDLIHRDSNRNGLLEWHMEDSEQCPCGESGLDNSPRFDRGAVLDAVDFSVFASHDMGYVSRIAGALGDQEKASFWLHKSRIMAERIMDYFWDETTGFYYDRDMQGDFVKVKACTGFLPLLLEASTPARTRRLTSHLENPDEFGTAFPVPSVARNEPSWSRDMWRGPTWINIDYLIIRGLKKHGQERLADRLTDVLIDRVLVHYERSGVIFEFYDSTDQVLPEALDRM